jgi:plasmid stabilization system protein ParE
LTTAYVLTAAAEADLRSIIRYSRQQWGDAQTRRYIADLTEGIEQIARGQGRWKDMSSLHPGLRMARCQQHYLFCLPRNGEPTLIVAILRERMDLIARLSTRLAQ